MGDASSLDWSTIGINIGVFGAALGALYTGIKTGLKKVSKGEIAPEPALITPKQVAAATLIETTTLLLWSESNRAVVETMNRLCNLINNVAERFETIEELKREAVELRHQMERLRDKL